MTNEQLIEKYKSSSDSEKMCVLYEIYIQNYRFIEKTVNCYSTYMDAEDLMQESFFAVKKAADSYDSEEGTVFLTWLKHCLKTVICRAIANTGNLIRIPVNSLSLAHKYKKCIFQHRLLYGSDPSDYELCKTLSISQERLKQIQDASAKENISCIDAPIDSEDLLTLQDVLLGSVDVEKDVLEQLAHEELSNALWNAVDNLPEKQSMIINKHYKENIPLKSIAEENCSKYGTVKEEKNKALRSLKRNVQLRKYVPDDIIYNRAVGRSGRGFWIRHNNTSSTEYEALRLCGVNLQDL